MYDIVFYFVKRFVLLAAVILIYADLYSQQHRIDSLTSLLNSSTDTLRIDVLINLAKEYGNKDNNKALELSSRAMEAAYIVGDSSRIVTLSRIIGQLLNRMDRPKEAAEILLESLPIAKRNNFRNDYKVILNNLALAYTIQADYNKALNINFETLELREADKDKAEISISLNNIGFVYFKTGNFEKALEFYMHSLRLKNEVNDNYDLDRLLVNIGLCYNELNGFKKALEYFNRAIQECGENCSEQLKVEVQNGLGISELGLNNIDDAENNFNKSYLIAKKVGNKRFQAENLIFIAQILMIKKDEVSAIAALRECEEIAVEFGYTEILIKTYLQLSMLFRQVKNYEKTAYFQSKYISLKDSIYSGELIHNLARIQTNYAERENISIIATKEEVIQRQRSLNIAIGVIATLACLLIFVLYHSIKVKKRVNVALSEAKHFIELKNKELDKKVAEKTADLEVANESLSKVNEELDNFIYKTSHDIRGPLASLKGICNVAIMDVKDEVALSYLNKLDITAEHLNTILTRLLIINQINNSSMKPERINFDAIIEEVLMLERKKGLPTKITIKRQIQPDTKFYSDKEFIRIVLENLIDNAIKFHNDSSRVEPFVSIRVEEDHEELKIHVIDNGIGISEAKPDKIFQMFSRASERSSTGGIGLYITKTATEKLGGVVGLKTTPEGYTEFYVKFPLKQQWFDAPEWNS